MVSDILTGVGAVAGAAATLDQMRLNREAMRQQSKQIKSAQKFNKKAQKLAEDMPEYDPITGQKIDNVLSQNIAQAERGLQDIEGITSRENVFNIEEARRTNAFIREELNRFLPGYEQLQKTMSEVIAANLAGDMTQAEKAALLEDVRTAAANRGVTGGVEDTASMLAFFDRRRSLMNTGVGQNLQATQLAKQVMYEPPTTLRRQFGELGTISGAQRLGTEQTERLNQYNARVNAIKTQIQTLQAAANTAIGAASQTQPAMSPLAALAPLLQGFSDIAGRIETRRAENQRYNEAIELRRRELEALERLNRRFG